jgi:hypothetical protein
MKIHNRLFRLFPLFVAIAFICLAAIPSPAHHEEKQTEVPPESSDSPAPGPDLETPAENLYGCVRIVAGA